MTIHEYETGAANYTGDPHRTHHNVEETLFLLADGDFGTDGTVAIEFRNPDGGYRAFPDTQLSSAGTRRLVMPPGQTWRLNIDNCVGVNVEVR